MVKTCHELSAILEMAEEGMERVGLGRVLRSKMAEWQIKFSCLVVVAQFSAAWWLLGHHEVLIPASHQHPSKN